MIYLGNPTYCLLLQDRTDYWAYSSGHLDLTLRLYLLVIDPWNPHQAYLIEKLECVQRNVTRWIIDKDTPYEDRLKSLKLATLVQRREFLSLVQLFKFIKGHSSVNTNNYISFSNRQSRKSHQFKLYKPFSRTDIFKYSFWHRHIDTWNSLPSSVVELDSINAFKKALKSTFFN